MRAYGGANTRLTKSFTQDLNRLAKRSTGATLLRYLRTLCDILSHWLLDYSSKKNRAKRRVVRRSRSNPEVIPEPIPLLQYVEHDDLHLLRLESFTEERLQPISSIAALPIQSGIRNIYALSRGLPLFLALLHFSAIWRSRSTASVVAHFCADSEGEKYNGNSLRPRHSSLAL